MTGGKVVDIQKRRHDEIMAELREHRRETREQTELLASFHRSMSSKLERLNKRLDQMQEDLLDTIKIELGGSGAALETRLERRVDDRLKVDLEDLLARVEALEKGASP